MADEVKRIEVDIGAAAAMLEASPELCAMMNELVGGPALVEAQAEIERLRAQIEDAETALNVWDGCHDSEYWLRHPRDPSDLIASSV